MYYFYKKHTLTAKSNRNRKKTLKVQFFFSHGKSNSCSVLIAYFGTGTFIVKKQQTDKEGCILILAVSINDSEYILINLYNANTENEQINVLSNPTKQLVMTGNFNLFFNSELEAQGGNPILKLKNLQLHSLNLKRLMIYVIYRGVRILKSKRLTFTQKHSSGFIQRRLDYILISYTLQEFVTMTEILTPVSTDHSLVLFSL